MAEKLKYYYAKNLKTGLFLTRLSGGRWSTRGQKEDLHAGEAGRHRLERAIEENGYHGFEVRRWFETEEEEVEELLFGE